MTAIAEDVARLRSEIKEHKRAIREHRDALGTKAAKLAALEIEVRHFGIKFTTTIQAKRETHGHSTDPA